MSLVEPRRKVHNKSDWYGIVREGMVVALIQWMDPDIKATSQWGGVAVL